MEKPRRYDSYYFGFSETNQPDIDKVLSAICYAGKGYHHTDGWGEAVSDYGDFYGGSYVAWIQNAANEAAQRIKQLEDALKELGSAVVYAESQSTYFGNVATAPDVFYAAQHSVDKFRKILSEHREILDTINKRGEE